MANNPVNTNSSHKTTEWNKNKEKKLKNLKENIVALNLFLEINFDSSLH